MKIKIAMAASYDPATIRADKLLQAALDKAMLAAGFPKKGGFVQTKSGVDIQTWARAGNGFNHSAPMSARGPDKKPPQYFSISIEVDTSGESYRSTMDGPIGNSKTYFDWSHVFDERPNAAAVKKILPELNAAAKNAYKVYKDLVKKFKTK